MSVLVVNAAFPDSWAESMVCFAEALCIITGPSPYAPNRRHAVVGKMRGQIWQPEDIETYKDRTRGEFRGLRQQLTDTFEIVHDPHPDRVGLAITTADIEFIFLVPNDPAKLVK